MRSLRVYSLPLIAGTVLAAGLAHVPDVNASTARVTLSADHTNVNFSIEVDQDVRACAVVAWVTAPARPAVWRLAGFTGATRKTLSVNVPAPSAPGKFTTQVRLDCDHELGVVAGTVLHRANLTKVFALPAVPTQVFPDAFDAQTPSRVSVTVSTLPGVRVDSVVIRPNGVRKQHKSSSSEMSSGTHRVGDSSKVPGVYQVRHSIWYEGRKYTASHAVTLHTSWAPLALFGSTPVAWSGCELTYSFAEGTKPNSVKGVQADLGKAFAMAQRASGVKLTAVAGDADIKVSFSPLGKHPPSTAALGGAKWVGAVAVSGSVRLSSKHPVMKEPSKDRVAVIAHEVGHVLGLGHVRDKAALMYPTRLSSSPQTFTSLDRAGFNELYGSCR